MANTKTPTIDDSKQGGQTAQGTEQALCAQSESITDMSVAQKIGDTLKWIGKGVLNLCDEIVRTAIEKAELNGMRELLLHQGKERFGDPDELTKHDINEMNRGQLLDLSVRILDAGSWGELLKSP